MDWLDGLIGWMDWMDGLIGLDGLMNELDVGMVISFGALDWRLRGMASSIRFDSILWMDRCMDEWLRLVIAIELLKMTISKSWQCLSSLSLINWFVCEFIYTNIYLLWQLIHLDECCMNDLKFIVFCWWCVNSFRNHWTFPFVVVIIIIIIINHQSSIINHQSSIINHQSSIINHHHRYHYRCRRLHLLHLLAHVELLQY